VGFSVKFAADGRAAIALEHEPEYCLALPSGMTQTPQPLQSGLWLVLCAEVRSGSDRFALTRALQMARNHKGRFHLAIFPFTHLIEIKAWCRDMPVVNDTPVWLVLRDGKLTAHFAGLPAVEMIESALI